MKFRIWSNKEMSFVYDGFWLESDYGVIEIHPRPDDDSILSFYTGMNDVYNKEIFENDVIYFNLHDDPLKTDHIGKVVYNPSMARFELNNPYENIPLGLTCKRLILGNIFENKNLNLIV